MISGDHKDYTESNSHFIAYFIGSAEYVIYRAWLIVF